MTTTPEKWYDAIASCQAKKMVLARPMDSTQNKDIGKSLKKSGSYWIGPYNNTVSNKWMFDTGYPLKYTSWATGRGIYRDNTVTRIIIWVRFVIVSNVLTKNMIF